MEEIVEITEKAEYSRFKGADWFSNIYQKDVLVIGSGGISSWTNLLLARCGANIHVFDYDLVESHNISGQLFKTKDANKPKVEAIKQIISEFCDNEVIVETYQEKYDVGSISNNIVIMGVDNMEARKNGFNNWLNFLEENPNEKDKSIFIDGRLSMNVIQIFCIRGNNLSSIENYKNNHLPSDSEVPDEECTTKQTSHCAAMIASHIVAFLTNFLSESTLENSIPFKYEYIIPLNLTENE